MHHPLSAANREGVDPGYFQILHRLDARDHPARGDHAHPSIGPHNVHAHHDLTYRQEALLKREEGVLLIGVDDLTAALACVALWILPGRAQGQIHQILILVEKDVQDGLPLHALCLRIVGPDLLSLLQSAQSSCSQEASALFSHLCLLQEVLLVTAQPP
jgi:hypothetical protein